MIENLLLYSLIKIQEKIGKPIVVIRFNCDYFFDVDGKYYEGMFKNHEKNEEVYRERINKLISVFNYYKNNY